jgi:hypothetical protein
MSIAITAKSTVYLLIPQFRRYVALISNECGLAVAELRDLALSFSSDGRISLAYTRISLAACQTEAPCNRRRCDRGRWRHGGAPQFRGSGGDMSRISLRRITIAAALAALLSSAVPAQAAGWNGWASDGDLLQSAWQWVTGFWAPQAPARHAGGASKGDRGTGVNPNGTKSDRGTGIDPNGATTSSTPPCYAGCERGGTIDPNG